MSDKTSIIKNAIAEGKSVDILYSNFNGESSKRVLSDISFTDKFDEFGYKNDHIRAYCHKREEERSFKIDRILSIRIVDKPIKLKIKSNLTRPKSIESKSPKPQSSEGCYIATMVYGNYDHHQVKELRGFRDNILLKSYFGAHFVKFYYKHSPSLVEKLTGKDIFNMIIRGTLDLIIKIIKYQKRY